MQNLIFVVALMLCSSAAFALGMPELARQKNCTGCHAIDRKVVGPAWLDVAKRYKGDKDGPVILANKIKIGGAGIWGSLPMPPQNVSDDEARMLAKYILGL